LALVRRGIAVRGIEASRAMVDRLRTKVGGERIDIRLGDMAAVDVPGQFPLIFVVTNTLFCLPDAASQARCFRNAARRLADAGVFVVEGIVPVRGWTEGVEDHAVPDGAQIHT